MNTCGVNIGNIVDKESRQHLSKLIQDVFECGFKNHMSDTVLVRALDVCNEVFSINATISNNTFGVKGKLDEEGDD